MITLYKLMLKIERKLDNLSVLLTLLESINFYPPPSC